MSIEVGDYICKYTLEDKEIRVDEAEVFECGPRKYVQFNEREAPVKVPRAADLGRVWRDGKTVWLSVRDDEKARDVFVDYGIRRIRALRAEIDDVDDMVAFIRCYEFKGRSKCFGAVGLNGGTGAAGPKKAKSKSSVAAEGDRKYKTNWDTSEFVDCEQYVELKLEMLQKEMYIHVSDDEKRHLKTLKTQSAIDAAVRSIIDRHWDA